MPKHSKLLICSAALLSGIAGTGFAQIPSRDSNITDLERGQIERDRATQAERDRMAQDGSTLNGELMLNSQLTRPWPPAGMHKPAFIMPPRRPLSSLIPDFELPTESDGGAAAPRAERN